MALHTGSDAQHDADACTTRTRSSGWRTRPGAEPFRRRGTGCATIRSPPTSAYQLIHDELLLDGSARLNLATFVTTWMEPQARALMAECVDKNMIDKDEYPQTAELERRCVAILADLWHAPAAAEATGCSTTGSSEACMLAGHGAEAPLGGAHRRRSGAASRTS